MSLFNLKGLQRSRPNDKELIFPDSFFNFLCRTILKGSALSKVLISMEGRG